MANFVDDNTSLPFPKTDLKPIGAGDPTKHVASEDWNTLCQAVVDLRTAVLDMRPDSTLPSAVSSVASAGSGVKVARINHVHVGAGGGSALPGWIVINDLAVQGGGAASAKVYQDTPNTTVLQSVTASSAAVTVTVSSSYPLVSVGGVNAVLPIAPSGGFYTGTVNVTLPGSGALTATVTDPNGITGTSDSVVVTVDSPPVILTLQFIGGYPGIQTELKVGDTFTISGTTDKLATGVEVVDFGACSSSVHVFASSTSFSISGTIADRGTSPQSLVARLRARNAAGAYGGTTDTSNTVILNNTTPTLVMGAITYPGAQLALKGSETATVVTTSTNTDSISFTSPNGDLSILNPTVTGTKTVTRIAGSYNVVTANFSGTATRTANGATATATAIVQIANVAPVITVSTPAARLRSGGANGTAVQNHVITITSSQNLLNAPALSADTGGGTFTGAWSGSGTTWTRTLQVNDSEAKGTYNWQSLLATSLSGTVVNSITTGPSYVLGGFVARTVTFAAFSQTATIGTQVTTYSKLQASLFTSTNQPALRNASQGDVSNIANTYTVTALNANPTTVLWNDQTAASANSGGTAQLTNLEETV